MRRNVDLTMRDREVLLFIWKWKLLPTSVIQYQFFGGKGRECAYRRLLALERGRFLETKADTTGQQFAWTLTKKGFECIKADIPAQLREDGFRSECSGHDIAVSLVQLCGWLQSKPKGAVLVSEQQLRRFQPSFLPSWIPDPRLHRPDGYWMIPLENDRRLIALEVELNRKENSDYAWVSDCYARQCCVNHFVWVVQNVPFAKRLYSLMNEKEDIGDSRHTMYLLGDIVKHGWQAKSVCGAHKDISLASLINPKLSPEAPLGETPGIFDLRKKPTSSKLCSFFAPSAFCDWKRYSRSNDT